MNSKKSEPPPKASFTKADNNLELQACLRLFHGAREAAQGHMRAQEALDWCRNNSANIIYPGHEDYPFLDLEAEKSPPFLACWGSPAWRGRRCLAVVGSREPSEEAIRWMDLHFREFLRRNDDVVVVSGGARGIDQKAHFLALRMGRPTVVFLPSGLARPYPIEWARWRQDVLAGGGAIISPFAPTQEIRKRHFEGRNRLIVTMGRLVFVVEARRRSGSSMTARLARDLGRTVCVLPASPFDRRAGGTVDLLFDGAQPIRDAQDLAALFDLSAIR